MSVRTSTNANAIQSGQIPLTDSSTPCTVMARVRPDAQTTWGSFIAISDLSTTNQISLQFNSGGLDLAVTGSDTGVMALTTVLGRWYDVALTFNGNHADAACITGYAQLTGSSAPMVKATCGMTFPFWLNTHAILGGGAAGELGVQAAADAMVWNGQLTDADVEFQRHFREPVVRPDTLQIWSPLDGLGAMFDRTGHGLHFTGGLASADEPILAPPRPQSFNRKRVLFAPVSTVYKYYTANADV